MSDAVRQALARAWALRLPYLLVHLAAIALGATVLSPLVAATARLAAATSGAPAVADQDIARLLLSPAGLVGAVLLAAVLLTVTVVETAVMIVLDHAHRQGEAARVWRAGWRVLHGLPAILGLAAIVVLRLGLRALPFLLAGGLGAMLLLGDADINFYLAERPPAFWAAVALGGLLVAGLALVLGERLLAWGLALPAVVLGGRLPRAALTESAALTAGRRGALLGHVAAWAGVALALTVGAAGLTGVVAAMTLPDPATGLDRLALHLLLAVGVIGAVNVATGTLAQGSLASLLVSLHAGAGGETAMPIAPPDQGRRVLPVAALLLAVACAAALGGAMSLAEGLRREDTTQVIAHRGASGSRPENTLPAIEQAIAEGADWIEIDVQETADGAVVVVHDSDFMKLAGNPLKIWDATLADLATIDVGAAFGPAWTGTRVPTLDAVLTAARGRARVLIELKHYGRAVRLEERVAAIVEGAGMVDAVAIMSLDHASAGRMKALRPDWRVGLLAATALGDLTRLPGDFLAVSSRLATPAFIARARRAGRDVYVWTVNDPLAMSRFASLGAAGLITDHPGRARSVLVARAEMTLAERLALLAADLFGLGRPPAVSSP